MKDKILDTIVEVMDALMSAVFYDMLSEFDTDRLRELAEMIDKLKEGNNGQEPEN